MTNTELGIDFTHSLNGNLDQDSTSTNTSASHIILLSCLRISWWFPGEVRPPLPVLAGTSATMNLSSGELDHSKKHTPVLDYVFHFYCNSHSHMDQLLTYPFFFSKPNLWACDNLPGWVTYYIIIHMPNPTSLQRPEKNSRQKKNKFLIVTYPSWLSTFETISHGWDDKYGFSKRSPSLTSWFSLLPAPLFSRYSVGLGIQRASVFYLIPHCNCQPHPCPQPRKGPQGFPS